MIELKMSQRQARASKAKRELEVARTRRRLTTIGKVNEINKLTIGLNLINHSTSRSKCKTIKCNNITFRQESTKRISSGLLITLLLVALVVSKVQLQESPEYQRVKHDVALVSIKASELTFAEQNHAADGFSRHQSEPLLGQLQVTGLTEGSWPVSRPRRSQSVIDNSTDLDEDQDSDDPSEQKLNLSPKLESLADSRQMAQVSGVRQPQELQMTTYQSTAIALAQEANKSNAIKLANQRNNAELCKNFSIGLQYESGGIFTSPNYPNQYPEGLVCTRLIEAPAGHYIVLEFRDQFSIEDAGSGCDNDKLEIRDGRYGYSKVLARYCGSKFPPEVKSSNEAMWLRFISDSSITQTGFKAVYRFEPQLNAKPNPPFECRFNVTSMPIPLSSSGGSGTNNMTEFRAGIHSGMIKSTDIPPELYTYVHEQNVSLECIWNITVMPGWKIYLTFANYEISKPNDCDSNFIEIYEENLTEENQTVKFCGTRTEPQSSKSNVFNIRHHAIASAGQSKFDIIYTAFREKGKGVCDARGEFDCDDGTCIHESLKCDGQVNCKYRYDEAEDPGPCQKAGSDVGSTFLETEHMVFILCVFVTLVLGMGASIIISCWGKIKERRRRKEEYHMRKSREASMEGQLNKIDQIMYNSNGHSNSNGSATFIMNAKEGQQQNLMVAPSDSIDSQEQTNAKFIGDINAANGNLQNYLGADLMDQTDQQRLMGQQYGVNLSTMNHMMAPTNYNIYSAQMQRHLMANSNSSLDTRTVDNGHVRAEIANVRKQNSMASLLGSHSKVHDVTYTGDPNDKSLSRKLRNQTIDDYNDSIAQDSSHRQMFRQQQQQQKLYQVNSIQSQSVNRSLMNEANQSDQIARLVNQQANAQMSENIPLMNNQQGAQTMPLNMEKYNTYLKQQPVINFHPQQNQGFDSRQSKMNQTHGAQRSLTLSTMHHPSQQLSQQLQHRRNLQTIYGYQGTPINQSLINNNNLSSSITCCNRLTDESQNELPLISSLISRNNNQQRVLLQQHQGERLNDLRSATMGPIRMHSQAIPRSISAHQLSKIQSRQQLQLQQEHQQQPRTQQQLHQKVIQLQPQSHQHPLPYKSSSDAGQANKHLPPNHSHSYPQSCNNQPQMSMTNQSPALPPPPPPPNVMLSSMGDSKRAAFKMSRLDPSQLTGDTLQDSDMIPVSSLPLGSMQFDDPSTESDATFGMLINSVADTPFSLSDLNRQQMRLNQFGVHPNFKPTQTNQQSGQYQMRASQMQQQQLRLVAHNNSCSLLRRQRSDLVADYGEQLAGQSCDCGAIERLAHQQQHQRQMMILQASSNQYDDSDECPIISGEPRGYDLNGNNIITMMGNAPDHLSNTNIYAKQRQQQQYSRFRQQSSEFTCDEDYDDEDDDDELMVDNVELNDDGEDDLLDGRDAQVDDEASSESDVMRRRHRSRSFVLNEELRDGPSRHLSGSRSSIGGHSCTCGSQLQLDRIGSNESSRKQPSVAKPKDSTTEVIDKRRYQKDARGSKDDVRVERTSNVDRGNKDIEVENCDIKAFKPTNAGETSN